MYALATVGSGAQQDVSYAVQLMVAKRFRPVRAQGQEARDAGVSDVCRLLAAPEDLARLQQLRAEVGATVRSNIQQFLSYCKA